MSDIAQDGLIGYHPDFAGCHHPHGALMKLLISRHAVQSMLQHALSTQPAICCGLCGGDQQHIRLALPVANISQDTCQECILDAKESREILKGWNQQGVSWLGVYHSHPDSFSLEQHQLPKMLERLIRQSPETASRLDTLWQLLIALDTKGRLEVRAFSQAAERDTEIPVVMLEDDQVVPTTK
jgi:hypothetical protein